MAVDDLGSVVTPPRPVARVVSLVPSLTESVASVRPEALVGATDWCTHPADLACRRVRGTKNPDVAAIVDLAPDLVIANKEENRELDVRRLRAAGVPVWVTDIESIEGAVMSLERLFRDALDWPIPEWVARAREEWAKAPSTGSVRAVALIWRDPWMAIGAPTFADDLLSRIGIENPLREAPGRYPTVTLAELRDLDLDLVILPDEPYSFGPEDGPECFPGVPTALVSGRLLTWYGPSLVPARSELERAIRQAHSPSR